MYKHKNITALFLAASLMAGSMASCSDGWMDVESKTESNTGNFYKNVNDAESALIGCYSAWRRTSSDNTWGFPVISMLMSDECYAGAGVSDTRDYAVPDRFDQGMYAAGTSLLESSWNSYYRCIYRCNELIRYDAIGQIDWQGDEAARGRVIGQARALRALCYFDMVRMWESVPLLLEPTKDPNLPQAPADETYAAIVEDFRYAAENIPADAFPRAEKDVNDGRITRYAVEGMLARVYLFYTGYYGKELAGLTKNDVVAYLDDVVRSGEYRLENYADLWPATSQVSSDNSHTWAVDNYKMVNDEVLLQIKFNYIGNAYGADEDKHGNRWLVLFGLRKIWCSPYAYGWGICTVSERFANQFDYNDPRRSLCIIDFAAENIAEKMQDGASNSFENYLRDQREYTGYAIKKYTPMCYYDGETAVPTKTGTSAVQEYQTQPFVVLRYSDILLMAAELGGVPSLNAQECFDQVRRRAYTDREGNLSANYVARQATKENIMKERMMEFAFEGVRYWDLLRQGIDYAANAIAEENTPVLSGNQPDYVTIKAENIKAKRGLMQIPQNQITLSNGVLKQNPGW